MSTSTHSINEGITKIPNQSYFNHNKGNQPTPNIAFFNVYQPPNVIINININMDTPSNPQTENTIIGAEKPSTQCEDEKRYDCDDGDNSNKLIKERSLDRNNQNCDGNNIEDVSNMIGSVSLEENSFQNSQVPDLMLNSSLVNGINVLENVPVETDDRSNDENKLVNGINVQENVPVETDDRSNDENKLVNRIDVHENVPVETDRLNDEKKLGNNQLLNNNQNCAFDDLSDDDKNRFKQKASLSIKYYCNGFPCLIKNLDQNERLDEFVDYFKLQENDRKKILLAYCGGGNPAKSLFEKLEQCKPKLKIKDLCACLQTLCLNRALEFLNSFNYSDEEKVSNIKKIDLSNFTYKLISLIPNEQPWKDVAFKLLDTKEDVNRIAKSIMYQNAYSPTEKLIDILSSQRLTMQEFLNALQNCKILDAYELMCQQIIATIEEEKKFEKK
ncbi:uncharacterized protein LOC136089230 isoform X2 [Hydra vulgaris]|uniref:Uncharacterized protein LOC136089230 isoform X2 n=1 Tax=Hydra vulgaris TaxID=6087 RepID=A0ABM4D9S2_HYDVU